MTPFLHISRSHPFVSNIIICIVALGIGFSLSFLVELFFIVSAVGTQIWLAVNAYILRKRHTPHFDMIVASEIIIAFGVFSLIVGLSKSIYYVANPTISFDEFNMASIRPLLLPFGEGLFAAGLAPLIASVLRQLEVLQFSTPTSDPDAAFRDSLADFTSRMLATMDAAEKLRLSLDLATTSLSKSVTAFEKSAAAYDRSTAEYEALLSRISSAAAGFASTVKKESEIFSKAVSSAKDAASDYVGSINQGKVAMNELTTQTKEFKKAADEGTTLLHGLAKLIADVERFIKPGA